MNNILETEKQFIKVILEQIETCDPADLWHRLDRINQCVQNMRTHLMKIPFVVHWCTEDRCYFVNVFQTECEWEIFKEGLIKQNCQVVLLLIAGHEVECDLDRERYDRIEAKMELAERMS